LEESRRIQVSRCARPAQIQACEADPIWFSAVRVGLGGARRGKARAIKKFRQTCERETDGYTAYPLEKYKRPDGEVVGLRVVVWRCATCGATTTDEDVPERILKGEGVMPSRPYCYRSEGGISVQVYLPELDEDYDGDLTDEMRERAIGAFVSALPQRVEIFLDGPKKLPCEVLIEPWDVGNELEWEING